MNMNNIFSTYIDSPYFIKADLLALSRRFEIPDSTLNTIIQRAIKAKDIIQLKRNYYVVKLYYLENRSNIGYKYFLSNILLEPSYISIDTALQYYGLLSEATQNYYTSITTKVPRSYSNNCGIFEYKSIKPELFLGYKSVKFEIENDIFSFKIAEASKAIFDYVYYRTLKSKIEESDLLCILDDLRVNYELLSKIEYKKLIKFFK